MSTNLKESILGVDVSKETYDSLTAELFSRAKEGKKSFIVAVNPEKIIKAEQDLNLKKLINSADYQIPDGIGVLLASKLQRGQIRDRITGIDLMMRIVVESSNQEKEVFLYGGKPGVAEKAKQQLLKEYPKLKIVGVLDGYQTDDQQLIDKINKTKPTIIFVALGSPRQEEWILKNKENLNVSIFQGVGGSFDVIAGNIKRAPAFFLKFGLEWLYRLLMEPWRWKRQLAIPRFLVKVLIVRFKRKL